MNEETIRNLQEYLQELLAVVSVARFHLFADDSESRANLADAIADLDQQYPNPRPKV